MAQTNYTPISLYYSATASNVPTAANLVPGELAINTADGKLYYEDSSGVVQTLASKAGALGDVVGPASATDNALARFDLTTGKLIQNSVGILSDAGVLTGLTGLTSSGSITLSSLTSGRVTYAGASGLLTDSANLLYSGTDLTVYGLTVGRGGGAVSTNTAFGVNAINASATGAENTAVGHSAGKAITSGNQNALYGSLAGFVLTTGVYNTGVGRASLYQLTSGNNNTSIGWNTMLASITANQNTAIGSNSLANNTADNNTGVGYLSLNANTTGLNNVALGANALQSNTTASNNTAVGFQAGYTNITGTNLTFVGYKAGFATTGDSNTGIGFQALTTNSSGTNNTATGYNCLAVNLTGGSNTANGYNSLVANTTGSFNTAIGQQSLNSNTVASYNTAVGYQSLYTFNRTANSNGYNTAVGYQAGYGLTNSAQNNFFGQLSGYYVTTGNSNTILGSYNGFNAPISQTGSNFVVLSDGDGNIVASSKTAQTFALQGGTLSSGTGIAFPATQSASSDANTLDDYEEGTWTPSVGGTATYGSNQFGYYTKVGNIVTCQFAIEIATLGTGSTSLLSGFPFTSFNSPGGHAGCVGYYGSLAVNTIYLNFYVNSSNTTATFNGKSILGATMDNSIALFGNGTRVGGSITYKIA